VRSLVALLVLVEAEASDSVATVCLVGVGTKMLRLATVENGGPGMTLSAVVLSGISIGAVILIHSWHIRFSLI